MARGSILRCTSNINACCKAEVKKNVPKIRKGPGEWNPEKEPRKKLLVEKSVRYYFLPVRLKQFQKLPNMTTIP